MSKARCSQCEVEGRPPLPHWLRFPRNRFIVSISGVATILCGWHAHLEAEHQAKLMSDNELSRYLAKTPRLIMEEVVAFSIMEHFEVIPDGLVN